VDVDQFWTLMESAREAAEPTIGTDNVGGPIAQELVRRLAPSGTDNVLSFADHFNRATSQLNRWDVWAAAYLIARGCSDDSFIDFKAGIVTLGLDWHRRVVADPDSLAEHPLVIAAATGGNPYALFAETVNYVPVYAFEQITGDDHAYYEAAATHERADEASNDMGEDFDFDDPEQVKLRLPQLAAMFRPTRT